MQYPMSEIRLPIRNVSRKIKNLENTMFYNKNKSKELDNKLFENPTSEYRGAPFWAWNCKMNSKMLCEQIDCLKDMGFGGFHMHSRSGMAMPYLGDEFMKLVKDCVKKAKNEGMRAFLYDEDRWPSGSAGGLVTKNPRFREHRLLFTLKHIEHFPLEIAQNEGKPYLIGAYDIILNEKGELESYSRIDEDGCAQGQKRFAYIITAESNTWFNNQSYADTLDKEAMDKFIDITYNSYKNAVGAEFGDTVMSIFTDEPRFAYKVVLPYAKSMEDAVFPWTYTMQSTFLNEYGYDICDKLPEIIWDLPDKAVSRARYHYHDHVSERFAQSFADNCGKWCAENGIAFTGHLPAEPTLTSQTRCIGEIMRSYRALEIPGIDMLCDNVELSTAKQCQSAVHQFGREAMVSELYGVTNWDFDFRGHKFQGDWQAALGVTVRVPHLSWVSMAGEAKRDYPASINYQSPWYKEYKYVEDHFARLNTALTRGKPIVKVGVIHPIESYWINFGPAENTLDIRNSLDEKFKNIINWLLSGSIDFDFICESVLPSQFRETDDGLAVGKMKYDAVLVPDCITLRKTTVDILNKFVSRGGKLVFAGECPKYIDAVSDDCVKDIYSKSVCVPFDRIAVLDALSDVRTVEIRNNSGARTDNLVYNMREDGTCKWLFVAHCKHDFNVTPYKTMEEHIKEDTGVQKIKIYVYGEYKPVLYDTLSGSVKELAYTIEDGKTVIKYDLYQTDSLLIKLEVSAEKGKIIDVCHKEPSKVFRFMNKVPFALNEPNVLLLDRAEYSLNGEDFNAEEEILLLDNECRKKMGWPLRCDAFTQPWVEPAETIKNYITLRFAVNSEIEVSDAMLAAEDAETLEIIFNGKAVGSKVNGWFADKCIKTVSLPTIKIGKNELVLKIPFGRRTNTEWCYILGDFGVKSEGAENVIISLQDKIGFSDLTCRGLPFYGANVIYKTELETPDCSAVVHANYFRGSLVKVKVDGEDRGVIAFSPYKLEIKNLKKGKHTFEFVLFGNRVNTFGALHKISKSNWYGPDAWRTKGDNWCYEYDFKKNGILASPVIEIFE